MSDSPDNRTSVAQLARNAVYSSGGWILNIGLVLVITPYFVFKLGSEGYGIYSLLIGLLGYYNLTDLGLGQSITKYVAEYKADENSLAISHSINAALLVQVAIGSIISLGIVTFSGEILDLLRVSQGFKESAETGLYICAGSFLFQVVGNTLSAVLKGLQKYDLSTKLAVLTQTAKNLGIAGGLYLGGGLTGAVYVAGGAAILFFLVNLIWVRRSLDGWSLLDGVSVDAMKELFSFSSYLFVSRLADLFQNHIVRFVISFFLGPSAVTFYVVPLKVVKAGVGIMSRASNTVLPYASELGEREDLERLRQTFVIGTKFMMAIAVPMFLLIILFSRPLLTVWMGGEFAEKTWPILSLLAIDKVMATLSMVPILIGLGVGHARARAYFSLVAVAMYATLLPLLTDAFGLHGTVIAAIISALPGVVFIGYVAWYILDYSLQTYVYKTLTVHAAPAVAVAGVMLVGGAELIPKTIWGLALAPPIGLLYLGILYAIGWVPGIQDLRRRLQPVS